MFQVPFRAPNTMFYLTKTSGNCFLMYLFFDVRNLWRTGIVPPFYLSANFLSSKYMIDLNVKAPNCKKSQVIMRSPQLLVQFYWIYCLERRIEFWKETLVQRWSLIPARWSLCFPFSLILNNWTSKDVLKTLIFDKISPFPADRINRF